MAPQTRSNKKRTTKKGKTAESVLTTEMLYSNDFFQKTLSNKHLDSNILELISKFYIKIDELADEKCNEIIDAKTMKQALTSCLSKLSRPTVHFPKIEIKTEMKSDASQNTENRNNHENVISVNLSSHLTTENVSAESYMDIDTGPNTTADIFQNKSFTLTSSSEGEFDDTAISQTTSLFEDMSMNEGVQLNDPIHFSTPIKQNIRRNDEIDIIELKPVVQKTEIPRKETDQKILKTPLERFESKPKVSKIEGIIKVGDTPLKIQTPIVSSSSEYRKKLRTPKTENRSTNTKMSSMKKLPIVKKENRVANDDKWKHASDLRQKFLNQKTERARIENERKAAVLERKRAQESMKSYKSPSRDASFSRRIEKGTPSQRPSKKTRLHVSEGIREEKVQIVSKAVFPTTPPKMVPQMNSIIAGKAEMSKISTTAQVYKPNSTNDYGIDDLSSSGGTDDESRPKKPIPAWAQLGLVREKVRKHVKNPPVDINSFFGKIEKPNLKEIFGENTQSKKRGSSAIWN